MRAALVLVGLLLIPVTARAASFDGNWSVLLSTDKGACDKAYRFPVTVVDGKLTYAGQSGATAQGGITGSGKVSATFTQGPDTLSATGSLSEFALRKSRTLTLGSAAAWSAPWNC
ncbi:hypothetical protein GCM10007036_21510 [Alsobacter metallidurans]|uniref:Uncharacterized protein n=1 Tax=Alsobacter metallidurans TaxID=340221 RepID=A0A917MHU2_9HYPH|nr:hypothetical protein [Alsobacter metallidurans]GGH18974.1 hypothetical protein GCM10007036_21510 [Alsobacter metallidurans]